VVKVPASALSYYKEKTGIWVEEVGKAHFVALKILARGHKEVAVSGLEEGRTILIESAKNKPLKEGSSVH
jgi:hypothetical protein